jgi:TolA-binding protein
MKYHILKISVVLAVILIPGCGVWHNFTTYFNLYYNTKDAFQQAEEMIMLEERSIFETDDLVVPGTANQLLNKVIEKSSKILQFHGNTSFVDNALLMLGKSFYYQKNYLKALRKFQELEATQPDSDLFLENELWIAKTLMKLKDFESALATLESVKNKAVEEGEDEIISEAYKEEIIYAVSLENYSEGIALADEFFKVAGSSEMKAEILYETGNFYLELEDNENALKYFERVNNYSPKYTVELNSLIALGRTLRELGENEEALDIFEGMRLEDKHRENFDMVDYEIGATYKKMGKIEEALEALAFVDTAYTTSLYSGLARYSMGQIYENDLNNFDSAAVYYQKATAAQIPAVRVKEIHGRNQLFVRYKTLTNRINDTRKQIIYIDEPETFIQDSIAYYDSIKALAAVDTLQINEEQRTGRTGRTSGNNRTPQQQQQTASSQMKVPTRPQVSRDSLNAVLIKNRFDLANLYFGEMNKADSAAVIFTDILNDTSAAEYHSRTMYALGSYYLAEGDTSKADSVFNYIYNNFRTEQVANAAALQLNKPLINISYDPAENIYADAERLWLQGNADSSLSVYRKVYEEFPNSSYAPKALLASGMILENDIMMPDSAAAVYDSIASRYPGTAYAQRINPKLTVYKQEQMRIQREIEDSIRAANQQDSIHIETPIAIPDTMSEADRIRLEIEKAEQDNTQVDIPQDDSLKIEGIKPDTLQQKKPEEDRDRRNPRRR